MAEPEPTPTTPAPAGQPVSDEAVVRRVRAGDLDAYEIVMRRYNQRLFRVARSILHNDADAEDAVQEAYIRAYNNLHRYAPTGRFGAWLTRIATNEALMQKRKRHRHTEQQTGTRIDHEGPVEHRSDSPGPMDQTAHGELVRLIEGAIDRLPEGFASVFMLRSVEQLSVAETAESLGIPEATVKTRLHRARMLIQQDLENTVGTAELEAFGFAGARCDRMVRCVFERLVESTSGW